MEKDQKSRVNGGLGKSVSKRRKQAALRDAAERSSQTWASSLRWIEQEDGN